MSGLDSWEDDPAAQDDNLSKQTQQNLNLNGQARTFQPGAASFQPSAQSFQPSQGYQQYGGGGYNQYSQYYNQGQQYGGGAAGGGNYPQHGQQGYGQGYNNQGYGQQNIYDPSYNGQYPNYQQQQPQQPQQPRQTPIIAKRPTGDNSKPESAVSETKKDPPAALGAKVLTISDTSSQPAKVLSIGNTGAAAPKAKVLSIGNTGVTPKKEKEKEEKKDVAKAPAEQGAKVTAAKAVDKSGEAGLDANGKTSGKSSPTPGDAKAPREVDAVAKEQAQEVDEEVLEEVYGKEHVNIIFIGHVDAGKSTLGGSILYCTGMVDERTMEKYKKEAKEAGRETWYLSWALDLTKEERAKGKTVEVGRGFFETEKRRYSILDAPGHKNFVPSMIGGASQADIGILVISARRGEYETGFEKGGQTREHAILAKTQGVSQLCVCVNKMDDPTVECNSSQDRYNECTTKVEQFLKGLGYAKKDLMWMPIAAQTTINIKNRIPNGICPWYEGPSLLEYLDGLKTLTRNVSAEFMMPVSGKYREMGTMIEGKIEAGRIRKGTYTMMPNQESVSIAALYGETEEEIPSASCGEQVRVRLKGIEEEDILPGFVLCSPKRLVHCVSAFEAQIVLLELKTILSAGFGCVLHVHSAIEEVQFESLLHKLQKGTGRKSKKPPAFASKGDSIIARLKITGGAGRVCVERFEDYGQMGRFTLRDQGQTIAIGKITKLITDSEN